MENFNRLAHVLRSYCPEADQPKLEVTLQEIRQIHHGDPNATLKALAGMIYDGLAYGNWPWVPAATA